MTRQGYLCCLFWKNTTYFSALSRILAEISERQAEPIQKAADLVAQSIAGGGVVQTFGSGHSHMIAEEAFFRAGGAQRKAAPYRFQTLIEATAEVR